MELNQNISKIRKERGLSQEALAEKLSVSRQAVSKWETGEAVPELQKLIMLCDILGVSMDKLCGREKGKKENAVTAQPARHTGRRPIPTSTACFCPSPTAATSAAGTVSSRHGRTGTANLPARS